MQYKIIPLFFLRGAYLILPGANNVCLCCPVQMSEGKIRNSNSPQKEEISVLHKNIEDHKSMPYPLLKSSVQPHHCQNSQSKSHEVKEGSFKICQKCVAFRIFGVNPFSFFLLKGLPTKPCLGRENGDLPSFAPPTLSKLFTKSVGRMKEGLPGI